MRKRIIEWGKSGDSRKEANEISGDLNERVLESRTWSLICRDLFRRMGITQAAIPLVIAELNEACGDAINRPDRVREKLALFWRGQFSDLAESAVAMLKDTGMIKRRNLIQNVMETLITDEEDLALFVGDDTPSWNRLAATKILEPLLRDLFDTVYSDTIELEIGIEIQVKKLARAAHREEWTSQLRMGEKESVALTFARKNLCFELQKTEAELSRQSPISLSQSGALQQRLKGVADRITTWFTAFSK